MKYLILSFIGDDKPGFVRDIADVVATHEGNWLESRMTELNGKFAGLARIAAGEDKIAALTQALEAFAEGSFRLIIADADEQPQSEGKTYVLDILGNDRPGIIQETTRALAEHGINLLEVASNVAPAAMSGAMMFSCSATIEVDPDLSMAAVDSQLSEIGAALGVDIQLEETAS